MKKLSIALLLLILFLTQLSGQTSDSLFDKIKGVWAATKWVDCIKETHSPGLAGIKIHGVTQAIITQKDNSNWLDLFFDNGHTATGPIPFKEIIKVTQNQYLLQFPHDTGDEYIDTVSTAKILLLGKDSMIVLSNLMFSINKPSDTLIRIEPSLLSFVNSNTVAGKYYDKHGTEYLFGVDGKGHRGIKKLTYDVSIDCTFIGDIDIVRLNFADKTTKDYGFRNQNGILRLYELVQSDQCGDVMNQGKLVTILYPQRGVIK